MCPLYVSGLIGPGRSQEHSTDGAAACARRMRSIAPLHRRRGLGCRAAEGIVVSDEEDNATNLKSIIELAEKTRLPTIYPFAFFVEAGGLMSYGINISAFGRSIADMIGQVLKGAKPADIPIFQPTEFVLAINLKAAKIARPYRAA
jgi:hypothetical protein